MRKSLTLALGLLCIAATLLAQNVDEAELRTALEQTIQFENYTGPVAQIESDSQIRSIGSSLAAGLPVSEEGQLSNASSTYAGRYRVQRVLPNAGENFRGADIIEILPGGRVDHVDNIRRIISGYLVEAFAYARADAETLSFFVTIYNAVHRSALQHFAARYSEGVMAVLTQEKAGLSLNYSDWPGKTQIVIPLAAQAGPGVVSSVPAAELADPQVIENLRDSETDGIEQRQDVADLIDRSVEEETDAIAEERQAIEERQDELAEREAAIEEALAQEDDPALRETLEEEREAITQEREELAQESAQLDNRESQATSDLQRGDEIRDEVVADLDPAPTANASPARQPVVFANTSQSGDVLRVQYSIVDAVSGNQITPSSGTVFYGRSRVTTSQGWVGIVETNASAKEAVLGLFDAATLAEKARTEIPVYYLSDLVYDGRSSQMYAIIQREGDWYLGQFDASLNAVQYSAIAVQAQTAIILTDTLVLVTRKDGRIARLQKASLRVE